MNYTFSYDIPLWTTGILIFGALLAALEFGYRLGARRIGMNIDPDSRGGDIAQSSISTLLALIIAFTYATSVNHYEERKDKLVDEANAIGTAFLRAGLVDNPGNQELREALLDYARSRVVEPEPGKIFSVKDQIRLIEVSSRHLDKLWPITEQIVKKQQATPITASLVASVNEVIDLNTTRIAKGFDKLNPAILWMLTIISAVSMAMTGFKPGLSGGMNRWRMTTLAFVLAGVLTLVEDFDRPNDGFVLVSQLSMVSAISDMEAVMGQ